MLISLIATLCKRLGVVFLVLVVGWHLSHGSASRRGKAIIRMDGRHDIVVSIDQMDRLVSSSMGGPMACELEPGIHTARFWQEGRLVNESYFKVEAGKEVVLEPMSAGLLREAREAPTRPAPGARGWHGDGLAAHIRRPATAAVPN